MTRQSFRKLIVLSWLLGLTAIVVSITTTPYLPPDLRNYVEAQVNAEPTAKDSIIFTVGLSIFIGYIITSVGLYRFRPWAKNLLLPINVVSLLMIPLYGPSVVSGWANALYYLYGLISGGILFLVYLSPVRQMFEMDGDV